jgi:hypothetical protein
LSLPPTPLIADFHHIGSDSIKFAATEIDDSITINADVQTLCPRRVLHMQWYDSTFQRGVSRTARIAIFLLALASGPSPAVWAANLPRQSSLESMYDQLAQRREVQLKRLAAYAVRGRFPRNVDFPGQLVPYFVDASGTACAVGHLMQVDDQRPLVAAVSAATNHVRIGEVQEGPVLDWILRSGLTQAECAFIQPSYACIEDYRRGPDWQKEIDRLQRHFAAVQHRLRAESQTALGEAFIKLLEEEIKKNADNPAFSSANLIKALAAREKPDVRIGAAYALARLDHGLVPRSIRLAALRPNLNDEEAAVRFWTAVAIERTGAASPVGEGEIHRLTLPTFLAALRGGDADLRLPSIVQLAKITPECINTGCQLQIIPEIRCAFVAACEDDDEEVRRLARETLATFRWQRIAYESQRMRRHYLQGSHDLECAAAEAAQLKRHFFDPPASVRYLDELAAPYDEASSMVYFGAGHGPQSLQIVDSADEARQILDASLRQTYADALKEDPVPFWTCDRVASSDDGLFFVATLDRSYPGPSGRMKLHYLVPRPTLLASANQTIDNWFEGRGGHQSSVWPASPGAEILPGEGIEITLGNHSRNDADAFASACDVFAHFIGHYDLIIVDRQVTTSPQQLAWSGRIAVSRRHSPRFFEHDGGGSSIYGGGGWDFHQLAMKCDRETGKLTLEAHPIPFKLEQAPLSSEQEAWRQEELKLMGRKPLPNINFFGDRLFPPEYSQAVALAQQGVDPRRHNEIRRVWYLEKSLPHLDFIYGLAAEKAGNMELAVTHVQRAAHEVHRDPRALVDIARWALAAGQFEMARQHSDAILEVWPANADAQRIRDSLAATAR